MHLNSFIVKSVGLLLSDLLSELLHNRYDLLRKTYSSFTLVG
jgi:hypothetical protein